MYKQHSTLIKRARIIDPSQEIDRIADVLIERQLVTHIADNINQSDQNTDVINANKKILAPGLVDLYSKTGEPGYEQRETLVSLTTSAIAGGFTRLVILPEAVPVIDNLAVLDALTSKISYCSSCQAAFWGAITKDLAGKQITQLAEIAPYVAGFADGYPIEDLGLLKNLLEYVKPLCKPIALVVNNVKLRGEGVVREGVRSIDSGLVGTPSVAEAAAIAAVIEIVDAVKTPIHLMRISTSRGVELIAQAKARGLPITASTTWMHLLLDTADLDTYNSNLRLEPPLGNSEDREALIEGIKIGTINAIAVDHTPYTYEEKTVAFAEAPPGAIGLEIALPLLWQKLVTTNKLTPLQLWKALSLEPTICLNQPTISCSIGQKAELILFDPEVEWIMDQTTTHSLSMNSLWWGKRIKGRVVNSWN